MRAQLLLAAVLGQLPLAAQACTLRMAPEEWPPYIYRAASGKLAGLDMELIEAIARQAGCKLQFEQDMPAVRRQLLFQQGKLDVLLAAFDTEERRGFARFSLPYRYETVGIFALPDKRERYRGVDSFQIILNRKIALLAPRIGWYGDDYERALPALNADGKRSTFSTFDQGVQMLLAGRGDLIMGDAYALRYAARRQGTQLAALAFVPYRAPVHLMLNAASTTQEQLTRINQAITRLEQSGALRTIRTRYGMN